MTGNGLWTIVMVTGERVNFQNRRRGNPRHLGNHLSLLRLRHQSYLP